MNPGIYDNLSNSDYHGETDWVSSSMLKHHLPEHYKRGGSQDALDFGTAFHTTVFGVGDPIRPIPWLTWQGKAAQEERAAAYEAGEVPILEKDLPRLAAMADAVKAHPLASELVFNEPGRPELSVFADVDGVPSRCRFDKLLDVGHGIDLKTTAAMPSEYALVRAIIDYGYDVSADHYLRVASAAGLDVDQFSLVFCSKEPPHYVTVVELDQSFYERAAVLRDLAVERILHSEMVPAYPGANERLTVSLPRWAAL